jgi:hypothetical protein
MMSDKQRRLYLDVTRKAFDGQFPPTDEKFEVFRHREVATALGGTDKRFRDFTNRELDLVLAHFRKLTTDTTDSTDTEPADEAGQKRRLCYTIRQLRDELPQNYAATVLWDRFKVTFDEELDQLGVNTLQQIRATLKARLASWQARHPQETHS